MSEENHTLIGYDHEMKNNIGLAIEHYEQSYEKDPLAAFQLANLYKKIGKNDDAKRVAMSGVEHIGNVFCAPLYYILYKLCDEDDKDKSHYFQKASELGSHDAVAEYQITHFYKKQK